MQNGTTSSETKSDTTEPTISIPIEFKIADRTYCVTSKPLGVLKIIARKVLEVIAKTGDDRLKKVKKLKDIQAAVDIMMYVADDALDEFYEIIQIIFEPVKNIRDNQGAVDYENMAMSKDAIEWDIDSKMMRDIFVAFIDQNKALGEVLKNMNALRIL